MASYGTESNNGLYFIVGGLVIVAALFGFIFLADDNAEITDITPSAGYDTPDNTTINNYEAEPATPDSTSTELRVDENGVSSTTTRTDTVND
jgi:hypothetical protein